LRFALRQCGDVASRRREVGSRGLKLATSLVKSRVRVFEALFEPNSGRVLLLELVGKIGLARFGLAQRAGGGELRREELRTGISPMAAINSGFEKAFATIADSNVTTLIAGVVLYAFGTGTIKSFAIVMTLGILTSLITHPDGLLFADLKLLCQLTDGNLNRHLKVLQEENFVEVWKGVQHGRPHTLCRLTPSGRERFLNYINVLEQVVADAERAEAACEPTRLPTRNEGLSTS
jgi:DNA-binding MarR family transcriptional regulator